MKRHIYKFKGKIVCYVDEGLNQVAFFRTPDGRFTKTTIQDAHALAHAYLVQLSGVTPSPEHQ